MRFKIIAKDNNGIKRCYGSGLRKHEAVRNCIDSAKEYLVSRPDIESLFLYDSRKDKPIIDPAQWSTWEVKRDV